MPDTLVACKTCGKDKASGALTCSHCGALDEEADKKQFMQVFLLPIGVPVLVGGDYRHHPIDGIICDFNKRGNPIRNENVADRVLQAQEQNVLFSYSMC